jgi:RNA polymerase sigma-70 factor (ECF subfamily)
METTIDINEAMHLYREDPRRGFDLLYRGLADRLATYLRRAFSLGSDEIADVVHDCFLPWVENPGHMKTVANPRAYLFSTAKYLAIQKRRGHARAVEQATAAAPPESAFPNGGQRETALDVEIALQRLPEEQREVLVLKFWGDLTFEEIAAVQEVSLNTAASRHRYALQKLKEILA